MSAATSTARTSAGERGPDHDQHQRLDEAAPHPRLDLAEPVVRGRRRRDSPPRHRPPGRPSTSSAQRAPVHRTHTGTWPSSTQAPIPAPSPSRTSRVASTSSRAPGARVRERGHDQEGGDDAHSAGAATVASTWSRAGDESAAVEGQPQPGGVPQRAGRRAARQRPPLSAAAGRVHQPATDSTSATRPRAASTSPTHRGQTPRAPARSITPVPNGAEVSAAGSSAAATRNARADAASRADPEHRGAHDEQQGRRSTTCGDGTHSARRRRNAPG